MQIAYSIFAFVVRDVQRIDFFFFFLFNLQNIGSSLPVIDGSYTHA